MLPSRPGYRRLINKPIDSTMGIFHSGPMRAPGAQQMTFADAQTIDMLAVASNGANTVSCRASSSGTSAWAHSATRGS